MKKRRSIKKFILILVTELYLLNITLLSQNASIISQQDTNTFYLSAGSTFYIPDMYMNIPYGDRYLTYVPSSLLGFNLGFSTKIRNKMWILSQVDYLYPLATDSRDEELMGNLRFDVSLGLSKQLSQRIWYVGSFGFYVYTIRENASLGYVNLFPPMNVKHQFIFRGRKNILSLGITTPHGWGNVMQLSLQYLFNIKQKGIKYKEQKNNLRYFIGIGTSLHYYWNSGDLRYYYDSVHSILIPPTRIIIVSSVLQYDFQFKRILLRMTYNFPHYYYTSTGLWIGTSIGYKMNVMVSGQVGFSNQLNARKWYINILYGLGEARILTYSSSNKTSTLQFMFKRNIEDPLTAKERELTSLGSINFGAGYKIRENLFFEFNVKRTLRLQDEPNGVPKGYHFLPGFTDRTIRIEQAWYFNVVCKLKI